MSVLVLLLLAWCLMSVPAGMLAGRLLSFSSRHDGVFVRAAHEAMAAGRLRRTAS